MSTTANKLPSVDEEEWIPELREEFNPAEPPDDEDDTVDRLAIFAPAAGASSPQVQPKPRPTPTPTPARAPTPAVAPPPRRPPSAYRPAPSHAELDRRRLEAIAARVEQQLDRQLNATMTIVRIKLIQELRAQLMNLYKDYGPQRGK